MKTAESTLNLGKQNSHGLQVQCHKVLSFHSASCVENICNHIAALLTKHAQGAQHKGAVKAASVSRTLNFPKKSNLSDEVKRAELELALATCCHCPTLAIDHLGGSD